VRSNDSLCLRAADKCKAVWGVPGYTLKGIERAFSKHRLTTLQAEIYLIRLRQAVNDREQATKEEREGVIERWMALRAVET
jgi:sterol 3beta-glucosyltransferase